MVAVEERYEWDFDMTFHFKAAQNLVAEPYEQHLTWFSTLRRLNTCLQITMNVILTWFSTLIESVQNLVAEQYEWDFDMIFHFKAPQYMVAEHYEWDFYMIFHLKAAQDLIAEQYEWDSENVLAVFSLSHSC